MTKSAVQIDQSLVRQTDEEAMFSHQLGVPFGRGNATSADEIRKFIFMPAGIEFRIVDYPEHGMVCVFIKADDFQRMEREKEEKRRSARRQRALTQLKYSPLILLITVVGACAVGLVWMGLVAFCDAIFDFSPNYGPAFMWPAGIVGTILFFGSIGIAISKIFKDE